MKGFGLIIHFGPLLSFASLQSSISCIITIVSGIKTFLRGILSWIIYNKSQRSKKNGSLQLKRQRWAFQKKSTDCQLIFESTSDFSSYSRGRWCSNIIFCGVIWQRFGFEQIFADITTPTPFFFEICRIVKDYGENRNQFFFFTQKEIFDEFWCQSANMWNSFNINRSKLLQTLSSGSFN